MDGTLIFSADSELKTEVECVEDYAIVRINIGEKFSLSFVDLTVDQLECFAQSLMFAAQELRSFKDKEKQA